MKLFDDSGYFNASTAFDCAEPFVFVIGGRGTGKTYGVIKEALTRKEKFVFLRRTQSQLDNIAKSEISPFAPVCRDIGIDFDVVSINKNMSAYVEFPDGKQEMRGLLCALSTISNLRGFDAQDCNIGIFDEFIAEPHEKPIKQEGLAFLNAYETINRNRELQGRNAFKMICLANSFNIANPIFEELGLINEIDKARRKGKNVIVNEDRGLRVLMLNHSPISGKKRKTALYKLTDNSGEFSEMSLDNAFAYNDFDCIASYPLTALQPIVRVNAICIYRVKGTDMFYCTRHRQGAIVDLGNGERAELKFRSDYLFSIWTAYKNSMIVFSDLETKTAFKKLI